MCFIALARLGHLALLPAVWAVALANSLDPGDLDYFVANLPPDPDSLRQVAFRVWDGMSPGVQPFLHAPD